MDLQKKEDMDPPQAEDTENRLIALVKGLLGPHSVFPAVFPMERQLSDLGISSLKMVNLMLAVEVEFDVAIPLTDITPENFYSLSSIQALVERILSQRKSA